MKTVFIDMDGVLVDLVGYLEQYYWRIQDWKKGDYDLTNYFPANALDRVRWVSLPRTADADYIIRWAMENYERVVITTILRPNDYLMLYGKVLWMFTHYPTLQFFPLSGCNKAELAPIGDLIDDADHEVNAFRAAGGNAYLIPRRWNSGTEPIAETLRKIGG